MSDPVKVDTARITGVPPASARPGVHVGPDRVTCHLTNGFQPDSADGVMGNAFTATGRVKVNGTAADLNHWDFGFIQVARAREISFYYAGKRPRDGSIVVRAHLPPALADPLILDTDTTFSPWTRSGSRFSFAPPEVRSPTGDHPAVRAGNELQNRKTHAANHLYHVVTDLEFWTVFSCHDALVKFRHMRHFAWRVRYDVMFSWIGGRPVVRRDLSRFTSSGDIGGLPDPADVRDRIANPVAYRSFNSMTREAIARSIVSAPESNRSDQEKRFGTVPPDFWT